MKVQEPNTLISMAVQDVADRINGGAHPTEALRKVASEMDLNDNYIQRVGETVNVALNYQHFKTAADKSVDFPIADIPTVIKEQYRPTDKTAAQEQAELFPKTAAYDEMPNYRKLLASGEDQHQMREFLKQSSELPTHERSESATWQKGIQAVQYAEKVAHEAYLMKVASRNDFDTAFSELVNHFSKAAEARTAFEEVESQVFFSHGATSIPFLDVIYKTAGLTEPRGVHDEAYRIFDTCPEAQKFAQVLELGNAMMKAAEDEQALLVETGKLQTTWQSALSKVAAATSASFLSDKEKSDKTETPAKKEKMVETSEDDPVLRRVLEQEAALANMKEQPSTETVDVSKTQSSPNEVQQTLASDEGEDKKKEAGFLGSLLERTIDSTFKSPPTNVLKSTSALDNLERKLVLQELLITDPILSKYPAREVAAAFEQLLRVSPQVASNKETVRAMLRQMLATQGMGMFETEQLAKTEHAIMRNKLLFADPSTKVKE